MFKFKVEYQSKKFLSRIGKIITHRGVIETPLFMPVGTQATVKAMLPEIVQTLGYQAILCNTYHLYLRPGIEIIEKVGGIHKFMNWKRHIVTDSGGFQVYSLSQFCQIKEDGILFKSHLDGSEHLLTPLKVIKIQERLGSDILMVLDTCIPYPCSYEDSKFLTELTHLWAEKSLDYWRKNPKPKQALFSIVQGGMYKDLRKKSARFIASLESDGIAIGGLSVGESLELRNTMLEVTIEELPPNKPRYLMGVGTPLDLIEAILRGVDLFDCVLPTRNARRGSVFTSQGLISIKNAVYKENSSPLDPECECYVCQNYSKAYLRHLFQAKELLAFSLLTLHNLFYYAKLIEKIKKAILEETLDSLRAEIKEYYEKIKDEN